MSQETAHLPTAPHAAAMPWTRTFYWSVRRELWEHRAIYLAPAIVAVVLLVGFLISTFRLPHAVRAIETTAAAARAADPANVDAFAAAMKAAVRAPAALENPYSMMAAGVFFTAILVGLLYSLGTLYGERRDRAILFWKSLPVSDRMTVLAKASVPLIVAPIVTLAIIFAAQLIMLTWSCLVLAANGISPASLMEHLPFPFMWLALVRGLIIFTLWAAPIFAWFLLVSGWAKRAAILWAIGPWVGLAVFENMAFGTHAFYRLFESRVAGGFAQAFTVRGQGAGPVNSLADLEVTSVLTNPGLWLGLAFAAACLIAAVRLRRYRAPI